MLGPLRPICFDTGNVTDDMLAEYITAKCQWLELLVARSSEETLRRAAIYAFAGVNPMKHHINKIQYGGMDGAFEVLIRASDPNLMKAMAGHWIVCARRNRAEGKLKEWHICMDRTAIHRRNAHRALKRAKL